MKLSGIISKKVLNIYSAKIIGTISDALFARGRVAYLKGFDKNEEEFVLDTRKIYTTSDELIVVKNNLACDDKRSFVENFFVSILGKEAFSTNGESFGIINEVEVDEKFFIQSLHTDKCEIKKENILLVGDVVIVSDKKEKMIKFKPKMPKTLKNEQKVNILDINLDNLEKFESIENVPKIEKLQGTEDVKSKNYLVDKNQIPQKVVGLGSGSFLQGRKATKTIFGLNNEILVKEGGLVTKRVIDTCASHNKLMELALNSI